MNISIIGTGYVGLTTGAILSTIGHKVYCIDIDEKKLEIIRSGKSYFYEPGLDNFVKKGIDSGNLIPTTDYSRAISDSEVGLICVGTPEKQDGSFDLSYIFAAVEELLKYAKDDFIIVTKSTIPVGTSDKIKSLVEKTKKVCPVLFCPEFLAEGSAVFDTLNIDRFVIGGSDQAAKNKLINLFKSIDDFAKKTNLEDLQGFAKIYKENLEIHSKKEFNQRVLNIGLESAELIKVTANAFLTMKISFANAIARICDKTDADINEVMDGIGMDSRIGRDFLYAGLGWGGGCFPKDVSGLIKYAQQQGYDFRLLKEVKRVNAEQPEYAVEKLTKMLDGSLEQKNITVWGLSFKPGTSDIRLSQSLVLIKSFIESGVEKIFAYDPKAIHEAKKSLNKYDISEEKIEFFNSAQDAVQDSDGLVLATDWPEFLEIDFESLKASFRNPVILDGRNRLDGEKLRSMGYKFEAIGR
jgi:UDPglucose 6-dehydrogenase